MIRLVALEEWSAVARFEPVSDDGATRRHTKS
jgi:hypothetical protein